MQYSAGWLSPNPRNALENKYYIKGQIMVMKLISR